MDTTSLQPKELITLSFSEAIRWTRILWRFITTPPSSIEAPERYLQQITKPSALVKTAKADMEKVLSFTSWRGTIIGLYLVLACLALSLVATLTTKDI